MGRVREKSVVSVVSVRWQKEQVALCSISMR